MKRAWPSPVAKRLIWKPSGRVSVRSTVACVCPCPLGTLIACGRGGPAAARVAEGAAVPLAARVAGIAALPEAVVPVAPICDRVAVAVVVCAALVTVGAALIAVGAAGAVVEVALPAQAARSATKVSAASQSHG